MCDVSAMKAQGAPRPKPGGWRASRRRLEGGSAEGSALADALYTPVLFFLLLIGLAFALVGVWRIGATMSAEAGALVDARAPGGGGADTARAAQQEALSTWADAAGGQTSLSVGPGGRAEKVGFQASVTLRVGIFGNWTFSLPGQGQSRRERFYVGPAVCDDVTGECHE